MGIVLRVILVFALSGCGTRRETYEFEAYELRRPPPVVAQPPVVKVPLPARRGTVPECRECKSYEKEFTK